MQDAPAPDQRHPPSRPAGARRQHRHHGRGRRATARPPSPRWRSGPRSWPPPCTRLGIQEGDRVGTFCWNNQGHLEAYLAIPSMGAVLHTLNIRLPAEQLAYVINHAEDRFIIVDASLIPLLAAIKDDLKTVETIIVAGEGDTSPLGETLSYERLLAAEEPGFEWPVLDERSAAAMCYTSGTTGNPKGVVYSHRSTWLHTMAEQAASSVGMTETDRILIIVPMFHANAWGTPVRRLVGRDRHDHAADVPDGGAAGRRHQRVPPDAGLWRADHLERAARRSTRRSTSRPCAAITAGGAAVPESLIGAFEERFGVTIIQGWGMTETSPLAAFGLPPARKLDGHDDMYYKIKAGRVVAGVEVRVVAEDGTVLPNDGQSVGEFEIRGPWITGSYYKDEDPAKFHDGWLRTGDVGTQDSQGYMTISDRTKDVIKSGGEWISSVELENAVMAHPDVFEAAVIAVPDPKWSERPLVAVVPKPGRTPGPGRPGGVPGRAGAALVAARPVDLHRRGAQDERGQVRQEGHAGGLRRRRLQGAAHAAAQVSGAERRHGGHGRAARRDGRGADGHGHGRAAPRQRRATPTRPRPVRRWPWSGASSRRAAPSRSPSPRWARVARGPGLARRRRRLTVARCASSSPPGPTTPPVGAWASLELELGRTKGLRFVGPSRWHVTLRFLGEVDEALVDAIGEALRDRRRRLARPGRVPARAGHRVVHRRAGPAAARRRPRRPGRRRARGHRRPACPSRPASRPFNGHLTLARSKGRRLSVAALGEMSNIPFEAAFPVPPSTWSSPSPRRRATSTPPWCGRRSAAEPPAVTTPAYGAR